MAPTTRAVEAASKVVRVTRSAAAASGPSSPSGVITAKKPVVQAKKARPTANSQNKTISPSKPSGRNDTVKNTTVLDQKLEDEAVTVPSKRTFARRDNPAAPQAYEEKFVESTKSTRRRVLDRANSRDDEQKEKELVEEEQPKRKRRRVDQVAHVAEPPSSTPAEKIEEPTPKKRGRAIETENKVKSKSKEDASPTRKSRRLDQSSPDKSSEKPTLSAPKTTASSENAIASVKEPASPTKTRPTRRKVDEPPKSPVKEVPTPTRKSRRLVQDDTLPKVSETNDPQDPSTAPTSNSESLDQVAKLSPPNSEETSESELTQKPKAKPKAKKAELPADTTEPRRSSRTRHATSKLTAWNPALAKANEAAEANSASSFDAEASSTVVPSTPEPVSSPADGAATPATTVVDAGLDSARATPAPSENTVAAEPTDAKAMGTAPLSVVDVGPQPPSSPPLKPVDGVSAEDSAISQPSVIPSPPSMISPVPSPGMEGGNIPIDPALLTISTPTVPPMSPISIPMSTPSLPSTPSPSAQQDSSPPFPFTHRKLEFQLFLEKKKRLVRAPAEPSPLRFQCCPTPTPPDSPIFSPAGGRKGSFSSCGSPATTSNAGLPVAASANFGAQEYSSAKFYLGGQPQQQGQGQWYQNAQQQYGSFEQQQQQYFAGQQASFNTDGSSNTMYQQGFPGNGYVSGTNGTFDNVASSSGASSYGSSFDSSNVGGTGAGFDISLEMDMTNIGMNIPPLDLNNFGAGVVNGWDWFNTGAEGSMYSGDGSGLATSGGFVASSGEQASIESPEQSQLRMDSPAAGSSEPKQGILPTDGLSDVDAEGEEDMEEVSIALAPPSAATSTSSLNSSGGQEEGFVEGFVMQEHPQGSSPPPPLQEVLLTAAEVEPEAEPTSTPYLVPPSLSTSPSLIDYLWRRRVYTYLAEVSSSFYASSQQFSSPACAAREVWHRIRMQESLWSDKCWQRLRRQGSLREKGYPWPLTGVSAHFFAPSKQASPPMDEYDESTDEDDTVEVDQDVLRELSKEDAGLDFSLSTKQCPEVPSELSSTSSVVNPPPTETTFMTSTMPPSSVSFNLESQCIPTIKMPELRNLDAYSSSVYLGRGTSAAAYWRRRRAWYYAPDPLSLVPFEDQGDGVSGILVPNVRAYYATSGDGAAERRRGAEKRIREAGLSSDKLGRLWEAATGLGSSFTTISSIDGWHICYGEFGPDVTLEGVCGDMVKEMKDVENAFLRHSSCGSATYESDTAQWDFEKSGEPGEFSSGSSAAAMEVDFGGWNSPDSRMSVVV